MHSYETDGRSNAALVILSVSVPLTWALHLALNALIHDPPWWVSAPSMLGVYSILMWAFDHHLWKIGLLRRLNLVSIPNLNGNWVGEIESSFDQVGQMQAVSVIVKQRWSKMVILLETEHSQSRSIVANVRISEPAYPELTYQYLSEPKPHAPSTMEIHRGTATLELKGSDFVGNYYSGRGRNQYGTIKLRRN